MPLMLSCAFTTHTTIFQTSKPLKLKPGRLCSLLNIQLTKPKTTMKLKIEIAMKNDKIISGNIVRKNPEHHGMWDIIGTRAGQSTDRATFTGTMREVRAAIKLGNQQIKARGL